MSSEVAPEEPRALQVVLVPMREAVFSLCRIFSEFLCPDLNLSNHPSRASVFPGGSSRPEARPQSHTRASQNWTSPADRSPFPQPTCMVYRGEQYFPLHWNCKFLIRIKKLKLGLSALPHTNHLSFHVDFSMQTLSHRTHKVSIQKGAVGGQLAPRQWRSPGT